MRVEPVDNYDLYKFETNENNSVMIAAEFAKRSRFLVVVVDDNDDVLVYVPKTPKQRYQLAA